MMQQEALMSQLAQELDNGRLLRLLSRLVMVSEGSQTSLEPSWSETGLRARMLLSGASDFSVLGCNCFVEVLTPPH